jgi:hypothetical protein
MGTEDSGLLCGSRKKSMGICCGKNNEALMEEDFSHDKPISYPVHPQYDDERASQAPSPPAEHRCSLKAILALLCISLSIGVVVALLFSSSSSGGSSSGSESESSSSGDAGAPGPKTWPEKPPTLEFYMYRAQADASYPPENLNTADLAGVFWYLHNEVVVAAPRKYRIDRIKRWKISMRTTQEFWNVHHRSFGPFTAFDGGRCTGNCGSPDSEKSDAIFNQYGYLVGCQQASDASQSGYRAKTKTRYCDPKLEGGKGQCQSNAPIWYSLPGECPTKGFEEGKISGEEADQSSEIIAAKDDACRAVHPGGRCSDGEAATGAPDCTFWMEDAGQIYLDELVGFETGEAYDEWWQSNTGTGSGDNVEYKLYDPQGQLYDKGVNETWWDQKFDEDACADRVAQAEALFAKNFPEFGELEEPPCDFDMWYKDEFTWPINHTLGVDPTQGFEWTD